MPQHMPQLAAPLVTVTDMQHTSVLDIQDECQVAVLSSSIAEETRGWAAQSIM